MGSFLVLTFKILKISKNKPLKYHIINKSYWKLGMSEKIRAIFEEVFVVLLE